MPTIFTHIAVPLALGLGLGHRLISRRLLLAGVVAAVLPDLDVVGFRFHIAYGDAFGHRGFSHSLMFALMIGLAAACFAPLLRSGRATTFAFVAFATMSHGLLDMFTNGGLGVALWWPFSTQRLFAAWQVIEVAPIGLARLLSGRGLVVVRSELLWVWLPAVLTCASIWAVRRSVCRAEPSDVISR